MDLFVSTCCKAEAIMEFSMLPDFIGDNPKEQKVSTVYFVCSLCNKQCDIVLLEDVMSNEKCCTGQMGWICPKCGRALAPSMAWCPCVSVSPQPYTPYCIPATGDPFPPSVYYTICESKDY